MVRNSIKNNYKILIILSVFTLISLVSIYNSIYIDISLYKTFYKQIIWVIISIFIMYFILKNGISFFINNSFIIYVSLNIILLLLLIFGKEINNAKCWIIIPGIGSLQPSEFMKISLIISLSKIVSKSKLKNIKDEFFLLIKCFIIILIPSILTFLEPDTGAVIIYMIIFISILFVSKLRIRWFVIGFGILTITISFIVYLYYTNIDLFISLLGNKFFLRVERLINWSTNDGMQLARGLSSIGSGGLFGFNLTNDSIYFPEANTDFIFAVYASRFGFIGSFFLLFIIYIFDICIFNISINTKKKINKFIVISILFVFFYQQIQNIGMTFGLFPIMGITLPFVSYGGSSLISNVIMISFVMYINNTNKKKNY